MVVVGIVLVELVEVELVVVQMAMAGQISNHQLPKLHHPMVGQKTANHLCLICQIPMLLLPS